MNSLFILSAFIVGDLHMGFTMDWVDPPPPVVIEMPMEEETEEVADTALDATLQTEKNWYLSRLAYEFRVRKDFTEADYQEKKAEFEGMSNTEARMFLDVYKVKVAQAQMAHESFRKAQDMRIQQILKQREMSNQRVTKQHAWFYPYTLPYQYRPYYHRPYYQPYSRYNYHFHWR